MLSVSEALELCLSQAMPFPVESCPLENALGLVLAEKVLSRQDSPPFDKALMDGFAVRCEDIKTGETLQILEEITAGRVPTRKVEPGTASQIMTGAPIPDGADAVVRVEDSLFDSATNSVRFTISEVQRGQSILYRGAAMRTGDVILSTGQMLRPQEIGVLAELGNATIPVRRWPRIAVLATGDELVPVAETPQPGQIRNSNEMMLAAQIQRAGGVAEKLGIARDERTHLAEKIQAGLGCDLLILSGGVSAGTRDLVPSELAQAGVREIFHQVNVKPGKPVWFGVNETDNSRCLVFGLPGNPVSSLVCFELFARPVIRQMMGFESPNSERISGVLLGEFVNRGERPVYHPAHFGPLQNVPSVQLIPWMGSADLRATVKANGMAVFPTGDHTYKAGTWIDVIPW